MSLIRSEGGSLILGCVYFPPNSAAEAYEEYIQTFENIKHKYKKARVLIAGNFNLLLLWNRLELAQGLQ